MSVEDETPEDVKGLTVRGIDVPPDAGYSKVEIWDWIEINEDDNGLAFRLTLETERVSVIDEEESDGLAE